MALLTPAWMEPLEGDPELPYSASDDRVSVLSAMFSAEGVVDPRAGQLLVGPRAAGANMTVEVAPGRAVIFGDDVSDQGAYVCPNTTPYTLTVPAAPASGTRTHRVVARVRDKSANGSWTVQDWIPELLPDVGAGTPAEPPSAITLALVAVPAGTTSITAARITDQRPRAVVGSSWWTGDIAPFGGWRVLPGNPPRYSVTPDGVVILSGQIGRAAAAFTAQGTVAYEFGVMPAEITPVGGRIQQFLGQGYRPGVLHIGTDKILRFSYPGNTSITTAFWISLDGVTFRIRA